MGKTTIGDLVVKVTASADAFDRVMTGAEKRMAKFGASAANPLNKLTSGLGSVAGMISSPVSTITAPFEELKSLIGKLPGGELSLLRSGLGDSGRAIDNVLDRYKTMTRESERLGVSPQFFKSLQLAMGSDADMIENVMGKFAKTLSELRAGDEGTKRKLANAGIDPEDLNSANDMEDAFRRVAKAIGESSNMTEKHGKALAAFGKSGLAIIPTLSEGTDKLEHWEQRVGEMGLVSPDMARRIKQFRDMKRELKLETELAEMEGAKLGMPFEHSKTEWARGNLSNSIAFQMEGIRGVAGRLVGMGDPNADRSVTVHTQSTDERDYGPGRALMNEAADEHFRLLDAGNSGIRKLIESIDDEAEGSKRASFERELYRGAMKNASEALREEASIKLEQRAADRMAEQMKSPAERFTETMTDIERNSKLTDLTRGRANMAAMRSLGVENVLRQSGGSASFIEKGSQADYAISDQMKAEKGMMDPEAWAKAAQSIVEASKKQDEVAEKFGRYIDQQANPEVIQFGN